MRQETNTIQTLYQGHYQVILDFPSPTDLGKILDSSYKYIWGYNHRQVAVSWSNVELSLFDTTELLGEIQVRNMKMEYLVETARFLTLIPWIKQTINIIQTNIIPPYYLNLENLEGKSRYDLLKNKIDYLFELEMPGACDYAKLVSPNVGFLEQVIHRFEIEKDC